MLFYHVRFGYTIPVSESEVVDVGINYKDIGERVRRERRGVGLQ